MIEPENILVTVLGLESHIRRMKPVVDALVAAGHRVTVAAPEAARDLIENVYGMPFAPAGHDWSADEDLPGVLAGALKTHNLQFIETLLARVLAPAAAIMVDDLEQLAATNGPYTVVISECTEAAGTVVAKRWGVRHLITDNGLTRIMRRHDHIVKAGLGSDYRPEAAQLLTPAPKDFLLGPEIDAHPYRHVPVTRPDERLWDWVADIPPDRPFGLVSLGSILPCVPELAEEITGPAFRRALDALALMPEVEAAVSTGGMDPALFGSVPDHIHLYRWIPQPLALAARPGFFLTHAGFGSLTDAVLNGVRTAYNALSSDQPDNAVRLAGVADYGISLDGLTRPDEIAAALRRLIASFRQGDSALYWQRRMLALDPVGVVLNRLLTR